MYFFKPVGTIINVFIEIKLPYSTILIFCLGMICFHPMPGDDFELIQQEIAMMQQCQHPNIIQYIGSYLRLVLLLHVMSLGRKGILLGISEVYHTL